MEAITLFKESLDWLRSKYVRKKFFKERDIVWEIQKHLIKLVKKRQLPYKIFNDYRLWKNGPLCDLVIMRDNKIEIAIEFKYEPSHKRVEDFPRSKLEQSFVFWGGKSNTHSVEQDMERVKEFVEKDIAKIGVSVFVDEGGFFSEKTRYKNRKWKKWNNGVAALISWSNDAY